MRGGCKDSGVARPHAVRPVLQVELSNGCICCTLREDLLSTMIALAGEGRFDYLLVESTGISEPLQVAEVFTFADAEGRQLSDYCRLDTCVTVVDAFNFSRDYNSRASLADRGMAAHTGDERHVVDLLIDQVRAGRGCQLWMLQGWGLLFARV